MQITVKLFATLRENREKIMHLEISEGSAVIQVIKHLEIPLEDIAIVMVNGRSSGLEAPLCDEDVLALFPPVGGG